VLDSVIAAPKKDKKKAKKKKKSNTNVIGNDPEEGENED